MNDKITFSDKKTINISKHLVSLLKSSSDSHATNVGANSASYYLNYYLDIQSHLNFLFPLGEALGIKKDSKVLEIGSGIGTRCLLTNMIWGADVTGAEPCINTYTFLSDAIEEFKKINPGLQYQHINNPGENLVFEDNTFDFILSFEVLEHVQSPEQVVNQIYRLLKPGGVAFVSTCNYDSFYEGHYRCLWLPGLSPVQREKWIKFRGYNSEFLKEINFITKNKIIEYLHKAGFSFIVEGLDSLDMNIKVPRSSVIFLDGVEPPKLVSLNPTFLQRFIQQSYIQKILSYFNREYKLYFILRK